MEHAVAECNRCMEHADRQWRAQQVPRHPSPPIQRDVKRQTGLRQTSAPEGVLLEVYQAPVFAEDTLRQSSPLGILRFTSFCYVVWTSWAVETLKEYQTVEATSVTGEVPWGSTVPRSKVQQVCYCALMFILRIPSIFFIYAFY